MRTILYNGRVISVWVKKNRSFAQCHLLIYWHTGHWPEKRLPAYMSGLTLAYSTASDPRITHNCLEQRSIP